MGTCPICNNRFVERKYKEKIWGGIKKGYINKTETKLICEYCEWKGNSGPGAILKEMIKEKNRGK